MGRIHGLVRLGTGVIQPYQLCWCRRHVAINGLSGRNSSNLRDIGRGCIGQRIYCFVVGYNGIDISRDRSNNGCSSGESCGERSVVYILFSVELYFTVLNRLTCPEPGLYRILNHETASLMINGIFLRSVHRIIEIDTGSF